MRKIKTNKFSIVQHLVFLYRVLVDIDQLKLIMLLVGTPGPELLMKISSDSVSSQSYARFFFSSNQFLCSKLAKSAVQQLYICVTSLTACSLPFSFVGL